MDFRVLALLVFVLSPAANAQLRAQGAPDRGEHRVEATLLFDASAVAPGDRFRVGVKAVFSPGWYTYWRFPGESGLASQITFTAPGVELGPLQFPYPQTFRAADGFIVSYGHAPEVLFFAEGRVPTQVAEGVRAIPVEADADLLVCELKCIPAKLKMKGELPLAKTTTRSEAASLFDATAARVPAALEGVRFTARVHGTELKAGQPFSGELRSDPPGWKAASDSPADSFVPNEIETGGYGALRSSGPLRFEGRVADGGAGPPARLRGVAHVEGPDGREKFVEVDAGLELTGSPAPAEMAPPSLGLLLLLAFAGGALLNLMPCVFPILAVKVYGFAKIVQQDRRAVALHSAAYAAGVIGSLWVLASAVVLARTAGMSLGWGFQFQEPLFVAGVGVVVVAFALNLFGLFQTSLSAGGITRKVDQSHGIARSAGEGVLAVLLATPCSAPMLGTAVGFAFAAPAPVTFAIFGALGLGLAAPFCLLVSVPGLAKRLPRPGVWMDRLKAVLGFALLLTAVWLLWVMGSLAGVDAMARLAALFVAVGLGCWIWGTTQLASARTRGWGLALSVLWVAASGVVLLHDVKPQEATAAERSGDSEAQPWSEEVVERYLEEGKPVLVDFTADWCLTCKFNERTVLRSNTVKQALERAGAVVVVGDWTRRDAAIQAQLSAHGRAGVPLYLMYNPKDPRNPEVLPELLTERIVLDSLARVTNASSTRKEPVP